MPIHGDRIKLCGKAREEEASSFPEWKNQRALRKEDGERKEWSGKEKKEAFAFPTLMQVRLSSYGRTSSFLPSVFDGFLWWLTHPAGCNATRREGRWTASTYVNIGGKCRCGCICICFLDLIFYLPFNLITISHAL